MQSALDVLRMAPHIEEKVLDEHLTALGVAYPQERKDAQSPFREHIPFYSLGSC
jgi:hypothetical protein